jgi:hypothetical protein
MKLAFAALLLAACHFTDRASEDTRPIEPVVVPRTHQIPPGHAAEVRKLFESQVICFPISVVSSAGTNTQFVNPKPSFIGSDRFVLAATPAIHDELDRLLAAMAKAPASPVSGTYTVAYWAIEADPSSESHVPADLAELDPVLKSLGALGPRTFRTIDHATTRALDGSRAEIKSRALVIDQTLSVAPEALELALELTTRDSGSHIETKLQLAPDKPIVLGETALGSAADPAANLVLYVVRAQRAE